MPAAPIRAVPPPVEATARQTRLERVAGWSFLLFVATLPWTIAPMSIGAALCGALTLAVWLHRPTRWSATPVLLPAAAWAVALVLSAAFALDRAASLPRLTKAFFPLLVPLAATHVRTSRGGRRAIAVLLVSSALAALFGLGLYLARGAAWPARARGAVGHYMTFGGQLQLWLALAVAIVFLGRERRWRLGAAAAALPGLAALVATYTRSAWIGLVVSAGIVLARVRLLWAIVLVAIVVVGFAVAPPTLRTRAVSAFDPGAAVNLQRTYMWRAGVAMFRDHPWTGVGLSDMKPIYDRYRPPQATERAGHLHSVPVQVAASTGAIGLAAFAWLYGTLLWMAFGGRRAAARGLGPALRWGVGAALVGFLVAGLFEWNFGDEELLYPLYTLVGIAWAARGWADGETPHPAPDPPAGTRR